MIDYPACNARECWYKGNTDRLNEYADSTPVVINAEVSHTFDTSDSAPMVIYLCDVCINIEDLGFNRECQLCHRRMFDQWITLKDNKQYCRLCLDEEDFGEDLYACMTKVSIEEGVIASRKKGCVKAMQIRAHLEKQVTVCIARREREKQEKGRKREERQARITQLLQEWVPALSDRAAQRATKRLARERDPPKIDSGEAFVAWLASTD